MTEAALTVPGVVLSNEGGGVMSDMLEAQTARDLRSFALSLGYTDKLLAEQFPIWLPGRVIRTNLVGFGSKPFDMTTATFVADEIPSGDNAKRDLFLAAETLAAPAAATLTGETLDVWWLGSGSGSPDKIQSVPRNELRGSGFESSPLGRSLGPEALLKAKRGTIQLALFPVDVKWVEESRGNAENRLETLVADSVVTAQSQLTTLGRSLSDREISRLVLAALTLAFVRDRFDLQIGSNEWNQYLGSSHPRLHSWLEGLRQHEGAILSRTIDDLSNTVNLAALDPALMSGVYERSLVSSAERHRLGVFYTPADLARRMLSNLPIEEIPPDERRVLDPTCGSGTLLLAAYDRLKELVSARVPRTDRHQWLVGHLRGWDKDPFAVEVARLCLTLNALPDGNGWQVEQVDALEQRIYDENRPTIIVGNPPIIVGNPPWRAQRTGPAKSRQDTASTFLNWSLDALAPEGMLAMLLPVGWLTSDHSAEGRRRIRETCEVLEVWRLPERTFRRGESAPAVLLARKTPRPRRRFHVERRVLHRESLARLYLQGVADSTTLMQTTIGQGEKRDREAAFTAKPLTGRVSSLPWPQYLGDVARLRSGPTRHRGAGKGSGSFMLADGLSKLPYFSTVTEESCSFVRWPEDFDVKSAGNPEDYRSPKLLLTGKMRPDSPWSSRARLDLLGVIPTDAYIMVLPLLNKLPQEATRDDALYAIMALCGATFVSAWIDERRSTRNIPPSLFRDLPLPSGWWKLAQLGRQLVTAAGNRNALTALVAELDDSVASLYGLDEVELDGMKARYARIQAPERVMRYPEPPTMTAQAPLADAVDTYGALLDLTLTDLRIWAPGLTNDNGEIVALPPRFPGALLYPGADFRIRSNPNGLRHAEFSFHASAWRSPLLAGSASDLQEEWDEEESGSLVEDEEEFDLGSLVMTDPPNLLGGPDEPLT